MSILQARPDGSSRPDQAPQPSDPERRRLERLALVVSDLAVGTTEVRELQTLLLAGAGEVPPAANLVKESADPIGHANVSAARSLGLIVPGP
jgi:hypothetical protein